MSCIFPISGFGLEGVPPIKDLLDALWEKLPENSKVDLINTFNWTIAKHNLAVSHLKDNSAPLAEKLIIEGLWAIRDAKLSESLSWNTFVPKVVENTLSNLFHRENGVLYVVSPEGSALDYEGLKLKLALKQNGDVGQIVEFLLDESLALDGISSRGETEASGFVSGTHILNTFKTILLEFLIGRFEEFLCGILAKPFGYHSYNVLMRVMDGAKTSSEKESVVKSLVEKWENLEVFFYCDFELTGGNLTTWHGLDLLAKLVNLDSDSLKKNEAVLNRVNAWIEFLLQGNYDWLVGNRANFLEYISRVLPCVFGPEDKFENIPKYLKGWFSVFKDPSESNPLIEAFCAAAATAGSWEILSCAAHLYVTTRKTNLTCYKTTCNEGETETFDSETIFTSYIQVFLSKQNDEQQVQSIKKCYDSCFSTYNPEESYLIARDVLVRLLKNCSYPALETFFVSKIEMMFQTLENPLQSEEDATESVLLTRTIDFLLLEVLFARVDLQKLKDKSCPIMRTALGADASEKDFLKAVSKFSLNVRSEEFQVAGNKDLYRTYHCRSYNALVSLITNTTKDAEIYRLLFGNSKNSSNLWKNLIDCEKKYKFEIDFSQIPKRRKMMVSIRAERTRESTTPVYMESQRLFNSTLKEDVCQYDFSNFVVRNKLPGPREIDSNLSLELEDLDINGHDCMATVCGLITHMYYGGIQAESEELPNWMRDIRAVLKNSPANARIFLVKVIENTKHFFKPYGKSFIDPIMRVVLDGCCGNELNFFVCDLVLLVVSWTDGSLTRSDVPSASEMLEFLMGRVRSERSDIFKHNLDLIKRFIEAFKGLCDVPHELLLKELQGDDRAVPANLIAVCLANQVLSEISTTFFSNI